MTSTKESHQTLKETKSLRSKGKRPKVSYPIQPGIWKLGQVSGITSIPEVERSIDSSTSVVYRPLAIQILAARAPMLILRYRDSLNNATRENPSNSNLRHLSTVVIFELKPQ